MADKPDKNQKISAVEDEESKRNLCNFIRCLRIGNAVASGRCSIEIRETYVKGGRNEISGKH
jgi:hypothetical protein